MGFQRLWRERKSCPIGRVSALQDEKAIEMHSGVVVAQHWR